ncbi:RICIN domain-containing protein [Paractinoplanes rishiriensis]|nr:RICIN domain-containing protein [Actinoplanes rishiriensis]
MPWSEVLGVSQAGGGRDGGGDVVGLGFQLVNVNSGKCLTTVGAAMADNAKLNQRTCTKEPAYRWRFLPVSLGGRFVIQNVKSGKCLTVAGEGRDDNDFAVQFACDGRPARQWTLKSTTLLPSSDAQLANVHSGKCLTIAGGSAAESGVAVQYQCDGERSRRWTVRLVAGPFLGE